MDPKYRCGVCLSPLNLIKDLTNTLYFSHKDSINNRWIDYCNNLSQYLSCVYFVGDYIFNEDIAKEWLCKNRE